jgi:hypothetical protein
MRRPSVCSGEIAADDREEEVVVGYMAEAAGNAPGRAEAHVEPRPRRLLRTAPAFAQAASSQGRLLVSARRRCGAGWATGGHGSAHGEGRQTVTILAAALLSMASVMAVPVIAEAGARAGAEREAARRSGTGVRSWPKEASVLRRRQARCGSRSTTGSTCQHVASRVFLFNNILTHRSLDFFVEILYDFCM